MAEKTPNNTKGLERSMLFESVSEAQFRLRLHTLATVYPDTTKSRQSSSPAQVVLCFTLNAPTRMHTSIRGTVWTQLHPGLPSSPGLH